MKKRTIRSRLAVALLVGVITGLMAFAVMGMFLGLMWLMGNVSIYVWLPLLAGLAVAFIYFVDSDEYV